MSDPPEGGAVHVISTFEPLTVVVGVAGLSGCCAASIGIGDEYSLDPKSFLAEILNLYVYPTVRPITVYEVCYLPAIRVMKLLLAPSP